MLVGPCPSRWFLVRGCKARTVRRMKSHRSSLARRAALVVLAVLVVAPGFAGTANADTYVPEPSPQINGVPGAGVTSGGSFPTVTCSKSSRGTVPTAGQKTTGNVAVTIDGDEGILDRDKNGIIDGRDNPLVLVFEHYPGCARYRWTGDFAVCPAGFEVWRFYGTLAAPVQAFSVSQVFTASEFCQAGKAFVRAAHPDDDPAIYTNGIAGSSQYKSIFRPQATTAFNGIRYEYGRINSALPYAGANRFFVPKTPLRVQGNCRSFHNPNTALATAYNSGNVTAQTAVRKELSSQMAQFGRAIGQVNGDIRQNANTNVIVFDDNYDCAASGRDFTYAYDSRKGQTSLSSGRRVLGACYMPIIRYSERFSYLPGWTQPGPYDPVGDMYSPRAANAGIWNGSRDTYWDYSAPGHGGASNKAAHPSANGAFSHYRSLMFNEVHTRLAVAGIKTPAIASNGAVPSPFVAGKDVGATVRDGSNCFATLGDAYDVATACTSNCNPPTTTTLPPASSGACVSGCQNITGVEITVNVPEAGAVGGKAQQPFAITTSNVRVMCGSSPCATTSLDGPWVLSAAPNIGLNAPKSSRTKEALDWDERSAFSHNKGAGTWNVDFFEPTEHGSEYTVNFSGTATVNGYTTSTQTSTTTKPDGITVCDQGKCTTIGTSGTTTTTVRQPYEKTVPIVVRFNPDNSFPVVSATPTPVMDRKAR